MDSPLAYEDATKEEEKQTEPLNQQEKEEDKPEETVEPEGPPQPGLYFISLS